MKIGIDGSRAFLKQRTGIEEYCYQVIKHLRPELAQDQVVLYLKEDQEVDFELPSNWKVKKLWSPRFWTQCRMSLEMLFHPVDVLFIPAHTVPFIHPKNTIVTIHGLEYETVPETYSAWERFYMRLSIKKSCAWVRRIIAVSRNTKEDLKTIYNISRNKIYVVHEGFLKLDQPNSNLVKRDKPYLFFVGRIETRKNIHGVIEAFNILKKKYNIPHQLVLAGRPGFGYEVVKEALNNSPYKSDIIELGFVTEEEKMAFMKEADVFMFPTFYEGFGLPILEAQSLGTPVVTSNVASLPEVGGEGVCLCEPGEPASIAETAYLLIKNEEFRNDIIKKGYENVNRFSWEKCAHQIAKLLNG